MRELDIVLAAGRCAWRSWLRKNHRSSPGIWLVFAKARARARGGLSYEEAVEEALSFGWIDSLVKRRDETTYLQKFTPRKAGSAWSASNLARWKKVCAEKRVTAAGRAVGSPRGAEAAARERKRPICNDTVPGWLSRALRAHGEAWRAFSSLAPSHRRRWVYWITSAKREETRQRRLAEAIRLLRKGEALGLR